MRLVFDTARIPRTTTRTEWESIWRWKRQTEKQFESALAERLRFVALYGTSHPEMCQRIADDLANPPVLLYP